MNKIITATKARQDFFRLIEEAGRHGQPMIITVEGEPKAVMMSAEVFESWRETLGVLADFPDLKKEILELKADVADGSDKKYTALDTLLEKEGYVFADKSQKI